MRVFVPVESDPAERRVALVPDLVARLTEHGHEVVVESGAGEHAHAPDQDYVAAGARIRDATGIADADVVLALHDRRITASLKRSMRPGFAGSENELLHDPKTSMLLGDAKESLRQVLTAVKTLS